MDILERIIENLTSDEVRRFKILSNRFKADEEKKLIVLFDAIRAGGFEEIEEEVVAQLYGDTTAKSKNNYYRLRNKLLSNLEKSLLFYHYNYRNSIESFSHIQIALLFKERGMYHEAYHYLRKAEKLALSLDQFSVLEVIYGEMVQLASKDVEVDIEDVIARRKLNHRKMEIERASSEVMGVILQQLRKLNFSRGKQSQSVIALLEQTRKHLEEHEDIFRSSTGKIAIYRAVSTILLKKGAFKELEVYIAKAFAEFEAQGAFDRNSHSLKLLMRLWRINSLRKLMRFREEASEIGLFYEDLVQYNRQNYNEYVVYFYNSRINNYKLTGKLDQAGEILREAFQEKVITQNPLNHLYLLISQADQFFNQEIYPRAFETVQQVMKHPRFNALDEEARFYLSIFELVVGYESRNYGYTEDRHKSFKKDYKKLLKDEEYAKADAFVDVLMRMNTAAIEGKKVFIKSAYNNFVRDYPRSEVADNQVIMYELYLQAKTEDRAYYEVFMEEMNRQAN